MLHICWWKNVSTSLASTFTCWQESWSARLLIDQVVYLHCGLLSKDRYWNAAFPWAKQPAWVKHGARRGNLDWKSKLLWHILYSKAAISTLIEYKHRDWSRFYYSYCILQDISRFWVCQPALYSTVVVKTRWHNIVGQSSTWEVIIIFMRRK